MAATHSYGLLPTVVAIHVILIISFTIAPVCKGDETFCEKICKKTSDPQLCIEILLAAPRKFRTVPQIQKYLLRHGEDVEDGAAQHYELRRKEADDRVVSDCEKAHMYASFAYVDAYVDYKYQRFDGVIMNLSKVMEIGAVCTIASKFEIKNRFDARIATLNMDLINLGADDVVSD